MNTVLDSPESIRQAAESIRQKWGRPTGEARLKYLEQKLHKVLETGSIEACREALEGQGDAGKPEIALLEAELEGLVLQYGDYGPVEARVGTEETRIYFVTPPVTLEDEDGEARQFGRFKIRVEFYRNAGVGPPEHEYTAEALAPSYAAGNESLTHPHVESGHICMGDGSTACRRALVDGRIADAANIIVGVLQTYNPESPYRQLGEWDKAQCGNCGERCGEDEIRVCPGCNDDVCESCEKTCAGCDGACHRGCMTNCGDCQEQYCGDCYDDEDKHECRKEPEEVEDDEDDVPDVLHRRLGQANAAIQEAGWAGVFASAQCKICNLVWSESKLLNQTCGPCAAALEEM